jgi:hypothetical protein
VVHFSNQQVTWYRILHKHYIIFNLLVGEFDALNLNAEKYNIKITRRYRETVCYKIFPDRGDADRAPFTGSCLGRDTYPPVSGIST